MKSTKVRVNLREFNVTQFGTIEEALATLPKDLVLMFVNTCWQNTQILKISDALGTKRPKW